MPEASGLTVTHGQLVEVAAQWLRGKCPVVITELATTGEEPDAIGFKERRSILVECKASRADFKADAQKYFRRNPEQGIGLQRYFLTFPGVIKLDELPPKWGLLELTGSRVRIRKESEHFNSRNEGREIAILVSTFRRLVGVQLTGVSLKCYTIETKCRATLSIQ